MRYLQQFMVLALSGFLATPLVAQGCGEGARHDPVECQVWEMGSSCHWWVFDDEEFERNEDPHTQHPEEEEWSIGLNGFEDEHSDTCGGGGTQLATSLLEAEGPQDFVRTASSFGPASWVEFNADRRAVQVLAACAESSVRVVAHLPVSVEEKDGWQRAVAKLQATATISATVEDERQPK